MIILTINCGSSSIKYRLFDMRNESELARGVIDRIGHSESEIHHTAGQIKVTVTEPVPDYIAGVRCILRLLQDGDNPVINTAAEIDGVGHRVVQGGQEYYQSVVIDQKVIKQISDYCELAPLHNPVNLAGIEAAMNEIPGRPHAAVFDTAFFQSVPPKAHVYALPYQWYTDKRIRRYGFHGTSHRYVSLIAAERLSNPEPNLITLHLGNGCSAACIRKGKAIDHSMGMTPLAGLVMGTRCGDVDPAIIFHLNHLGMNIEDLRESMENQSGLLGISGISSDMRDVQRAAQDGNKRAQLALEVFAYRVRKYLGAFMIELGKCDAIIFTGGIGEKAGFMREMILKNLNPLGIDLDIKRNQQQLPNPTRISTDESSTQIWVIPTNEELVIARDTWQLIR